MTIDTKEQFEKFVSTNWSSVNSFIDKISQDLPLPIYSSVDIRESKTKFAPVDNNIYPAGFNNICTFDLIMASEQLKKFIEAKYDSVKNIAIIPESNTKNKFYLDNIVTLKNLLERADFSVDVLSFDKELFIEDSSLTLESNNEGTVEFYHGAINESKQAHNLKTKQKYDLLILNHDQSSPIDIDWQDLKTPVTPSPFIGWYRRQKIEHFKAYNDVVHDFCSEFNIDPSLLQAKFESVTGVDFAKKEGLEQLSEAVGSLLKKLPLNTKIFVKASQGTYGMGIHVVSSADEVLNLNRKKRNKLDIGKNNIKFSTVLIQEGVETVLKYDEVPAEITIYLIGGKSVGGFLRTNPLKGPDENLNAKGMVFQKFCISEIQENADHKAKEAVYSVISRLSTIAAGIELKNILNNQGKL